MPTVLNPLVIKEQLTACVDRRREFNEDAILVAAAKAFLKHRYYPTPVDDSCEPINLLRGGLSR